VGLLGVGMLLTSPSNVDDVGPCSAFKNTVSTSATEVLTEEGKYTSGGENAVLIKFYYKDPKVADHDRSFSDDSTSGIMKTTLGEVVYDNWISTNKHVTLDTQEKIDSFMKEHGVNTERLTGKVVYQGPEKNMKLLKTKIPRVIDCLPPSEYQKPEKPKPHTP